MNINEYVHGYSTYEKERLADQANTLSHLLHYDSIFNPPGNVLEAGCGTGAQTIILAKQNPECLLTSIDISEDSLRLPKARPDTQNLQRPISSRRRIPPALS